MYDCLVISRSAISAYLFPWQLITLLVEYEPVSVPLFSEGVSEDVALEEYLILRTVNDVLASSRSQGKRGMFSTEILPLQRIGLSLWSS